ncbi:MAG: TonB-dependent receptor plug domain-containing protein [Bacteroidetes bacterium]|nr:TonB-dependent receptor plug domain-containing protein [Bacteroidota bacterium]
MKVIYLLLLNLLISILVFAQDTLHSSLTDTLLLQNIEVTSIRAADKAPFTKTNLTKWEIEKNNMGQDLPFILNQTPSVVVNSDAGNGIGYTGIHIRGTDATRINVTLNGIPFNDPESQGTFFVDMPDISSSVNSIQIQRGVGTSSNGAGAFGATINLSTNEFNKEKYVEINNSFGSFNSWKNTLKLGTGLISGHWLAEARLSRIASDGYIDRATSDIQSYFVSGAYIGSKNSFRLNIFSGKEKTYQAWNGVRESYLDSARTYNSSGTEKPGSPYANETDNYTQTHYQLFYNQKINSAFAYNVAAFLIRGKGYYEEYKAAQKFAKYFLPDVVYGADTISKTDLVRQLWLDNYFYGSIFSVEYKRGNAQVSIGGGVSQYDGGHYNMIKWSQIGNVPLDYKYYNAPANKDDYNFYSKWMQPFGTFFTAFVDAQARFVNYNINGFKDHPLLHIQKQYSFFNPKVGITYNKGNYQAYFSLSIATKEPNRDDFEAGNSQIPLPEKLYDVEWGIKGGSARKNYDITFYYMYYHNQLVNTGEINDVGAYTRTNTPKSFRAGIELQGKIIPVKWIVASGNIAFSKNKIDHFTEFIDDYDQGGQKVNNYHNVDISFSPSLVGSGSLQFIPCKNFGINLISKYVGRQYLDNTMHNDRSVKAYFTEDVRITYNLKLPTFKEIGFILGANNVFNKMYESSGYTYNYFSGGNLQVENYYFPMAGANFVAAINIKL